MDEKQDEKRFFTRVGGRKFAAWILSTVALLVLGLTGHEVSPETLSTLETIFATFIGGNALSHAAGAFRAGREAPRMPETGDVEAMRERMQQAREELLGRTDSFGNTTK